MIQTASEWVSLSCEWLSEVDMEAAHPRMTPSETDCGVAHLQHAECVVRVCRNGQFWTQQLATLGVAAGRVEGLMIFVRVKLLGIDGCVRKAGNPSGIVENDGGDENPAEQGCER